MSMSHRMVLTISDNHYEMLEKMKKERGLAKTQQAVRSVLEDVYISTQTMTSNAHFSKNTGKQAVEAT